MKLLLTTITLAFFSFIQLHAQTVLPRLVAYAHSTYDGANYTPDDSGSLKYSHTRVYNSKTKTFEFDTNRIFVYAVPYSAYNFRIRQTESYDSKNNLLLDLIQKLRSSDSVWLDSLKFEYVYDGHSNLLTRTQSKKLAAWQYVDRYTYTYDISDNTLTVLYEIWSVNGWLFVYNHTYEYDSHNNRVNDIYQTFDTVGYVWVNKLNTASTYNTGNKLVNDMIKGWKSGAWFDTIQNWYSYDASNTYLVNKMHKTWVGGTLIPDTNIIYTLDSNNDAVTELHQFFWGYPSLWKDSCLLTYTYDAHHNRTSILRENMPSVFATSYEKVFYREYTYNSYNQLTSEKETTWNVFGGFWEPSAGSDHYNRYYYELPSGVQQVAVTNYTLEIYPSPATEFLNIDLKAEQDMNGMAAIYDMRGKLWNQWQIHASANYHYQYPVTQLPAGNYIINIKTADSNNSKIFSVAH